MKVDEKSKDLLSLRTFSRDLYEHLLTELARGNIHSYDVEALVLKMDDEYEVILKFGDGFSQSLKQTFSSEQIESINIEVTTFFRQSLEKIKKNLIQEYYRMVKP